MSEPMSERNDLPPFDDSYEDSYEKSEANQLAVIEEPPFDPEDTSPTGILRRSDAVAATNPIRTGGPAWINWLLRGAAFVLTLIAAAIYIQESNRPAPVKPTNVAQVSSGTVEATQVPTVVPPSSPTVPPAASNSADVVPADVIAEILALPGDTAPAADRLYRQQTAFTIAPVRARASPLQYKIQQGDTLDKIAQRFGISTDTIVWNNSDIFVNRLLPGDVLLILPVDGIQYTTAEGETIQSIGDKFKVAPFAIIDSEYNRLQNARPETSLPVNFTLIIPGGSSTQKARYWNPGIVRRPAVVTGGSGASANAAGEISFGGGPGSCGYQPNGGGTGSLRSPIGRYTVIRGFFPGHSGIDLAAPPGTPVFAADGGTVIFAGWSNWGYGYSVVLAHGSMLTLYGHLSRINVRCGQQVSAGTPVGAVGSSGQSSGPHLHFEVRPGGGEPVNPVGYVGF
jgi:murein DD-endopeptidase MepM/ murein hydrolase activator NlpD